MSIPWLEIGKFLVWTLLRLLFTILHTIYILLTGKYWTLKHCYRDDIDNNTIQVLIIIARYKFDQLLQPSGVNNFIAIHSSFATLDYLLQDNVTLYYVNKCEAVFIETDTGFDVTDSDNGAFMREAQFENARNVIRVPLHLFHRLGEKIGRPDGKLIFMYNTDRCGSTLVTQVFEETGNAMTYAEPDALNALTQLKGVMSDTEHEKVVTHTINILCKPVTGRKAEHFILKPTSLTFEALPYFSRSFPDAYNLFLYRNGLQTAKSTVKVGHKLPIIATAFSLCNLSDRFSKWIVQRLGLPADACSFTCLTPLHGCVIMWALSIKQYLDYRKQGYNLAGINYDDIMNNTTYAFKQLFEHCGLCYDGRAIERAFSHDSQRASHISIEKVKEFENDNISDVVMGELNSLCEGFQLPNFRNLQCTYIPDGTVTHEEEKLINNNVNVCNGLKH